jgi:hypothetical protein
MPFRVSKNRNRILLVVVFCIFNRRFTLGFARLLLHCIFNRCTMQVHSSHTVRYTKTGTDLLRTPPPPPGKTYCPFINNIMYAGASCYAHRARRYLHRRDGGSTRRYGIDWNFFHASGTPKTPFIVRVVLMTERKKK